MRGPMRKKMLFTLVRTNFCAFASFPGSKTICPASCLTVEGRGFPHESRSRATYPRKLTSRDEMNDRCPLGIWVGGKGYTPGVSEVFHIPRADIIGGRLLSCYTVMSKRWLSYEGHGLTVKLIIRGGGVKVPLVVTFGPRMKRSVMALSQPNPTVAEKEFPGPDLRRR